MVFLYVLNSIDERGQADCPGGGRSFGILNDESQLISGEGYA